MKLLDIIKKRRSVRSFGDEKPSKALLLDLVEAARYAPSASNLNATRYLFVTEETKCKKIKAFSPGMADKAPVILVLLSDTRIAEEKENVNAFNYGFSYDTAMAMQNLMLRATELGLGSCAVKSFNEMALRKILKLSERYRIEVLVTIGYSDREIGIKQKPKIEDIVFFEEIYE